MLRSPLGAFRFVPRLTAWPPPLQQQRALQQCGKTKIGVRQFGSISGAGLASRLQTGAQRVPLYAAKTRFAPLRAGFRTPRQLPRRDFHFSRAGHFAEAGGKKAEEPLSLSGRLKKLSREYGWTAVGVYLTLSVLDFPFCFLLVRWLGTDKIAEAEHYVVTNVSKVIPASVKDTWHQYRQAFKKTEHETVGNNDISEDIEMAGWGVKEADKRNKEEASLATQLALAYAIHKSFIFLRVPLTAAILPKVVRVLRSWGWQIGKKRV